MHALTDAFETVLQFMELLHEDQGNLSQDSAWLLAAARAYGRQVWILAPKSLSCNDVWSPYVCSGVRSLHCVLYGLLAIVTDESPEPSRCCLAFDTLQATMDCFESQFACFEIHMSSIPDAHRHYKDSQRSRQMRMKDGISTDVFVVSQSFFWLLRPLKPHSPCSHVLTISSA